jgi:hypothetical protein
MEKPKKSRGFKEQNTWERSVIQGGKKGPRTPLTEPKRWDEHGASKCMVRTQESLRDKLTDHLKLVNRRRKDLKLKKLKEVDAVNAALFNWICQARANDLAAASRVTLVFASSFTFDDAKGVLGVYNRRITMRSSRELGVKFPKFVLNLTFQRTLKTSKAFKHDLLIVASLLKSYKVHQYKE